MPRLSTIIPHRGDDQALESTILSVLEHQSDDCEVILVHDGSYTDPYQLGDELLIIEEKSHNPLTLLNVGLMAACAPVVCVLSPGAVVVQDDWTSAVDQIDTAAGVSAVAIGTVSHGKTTYGISGKAVADSSYIQRGKIEQYRADAAAGPTLSAGFYDRRTLLALDGWNEQLSWENADIELALLMNHLGISCGLSHVQVEVDSTVQRLSSNATVKQIAEVVVAYGLTSAGASSAMTDLLRGCLGGSISSAVAWATGIMSAARGAKQMQERIERAKHNYGHLLEQRQATAERRQRRAAA